MKSCPPCVLALIALTGFAPASVVNIDFNTAASATYLGLAAAPDPAGAAALWNPLVNNLGTAQSVDLDDSFGDATGIGFTLSGIEGTISNSASEGQLGSYLSLMRDYIYHDSDISTQLTSLTGQFTGLVVGGTYDLYFYGQGEFMSTDSGPGGYRGQNSYFSIGGNGEQTAWDNVVGGDGSLVEGVEYVKLTAVAADGGLLGGVINFDFENVVPGVNVVNDLAPSSTNSGARRASLNAIQLVVVPEPSIVLLSALGVLCLLLRRKL